jgi:hypothetical protein
VFKAGNLPPSCTVVTKPRNRSNLEPSGPVQAFNAKAYFLFSKYSYFLESNIHTIFVINLGTYLSLFITSVFAFPGSVWSVPFIVDTAHHTKQSEFLFA